MIVRVATIVELAMIVERALIGEVITAMAVANSRVVEMVDVRWRRIGIISSSRRGVFDCSME